MTVPLQLSLVASSLLPSRQLLNDPLPSRTPLLAWQHPTFLLPEARIALLRSRAPAFPSAVSSASHFPEAQGQHSQRVGSLHLHYAAIRLAVRQPLHCRLGFRALKGTLSQALVCA